MRELIFRAKATNREEGREYRTSYKNGDWVCGLISVLENYKGFGEMTNIYGVSGIEVDITTLGQYTEMTEYVVSDRTFCKPLYEGDIVEVWTNRRPKWDDPRSQFDGRVKARAVIEFSKGKWKLNYDNKYNSSLEELMGKETDERTVEGVSELYYFGYHGTNEQWEREHNSHYKGHDIIKIGNIYDNPELLIK